MLLIRQSIKFYVVLICLHNILLPYITQVLGVRYPIFVLFDIMSKT